MKKIFLIFLSHMFAFHKPIDQIVMQGITDKIFPGAALIIGDDQKVMYEHYYGFHTYDCDVPVSGSTLFDLASLSRFC